jgi:hypothetical protein
MVLTVMVACTSVDRVDDPYVSNESGVSVSLSIIKNGQTIPLSVTVLDGHLSNIPQYRDACTDGILVAIDPDGIEVARHAAPLCHGETWTIGPPGGSQAPA